MLHSVDRRNCVHEPRRCYLGVTVLHRRDGAVNPHLNNQIGCLQCAALSCLQTKNYRVVAANPSRPCCEILNPLGGLMKTKRFMAVALTTALSAGALYGSVATADTLDTVLKVGEQKTAAATASQKRIDKIAQETSDLLQQFKVVNKEIDGLRVYNRQLEKQLANQLSVIKDLDESIDQVTVIERQIQPLILRMLDGLEQFIELDAPFKLAERKANLEGVKNNMDRSDITVAEKFRQVLELYNFEAEYARKIDTYGDTLNVNGQDREVSVLQIGRIALVAQTTDSKISLAYDKEQKAWVEIDSGEFRRAIMQGLKIAKKQATTDIMTMPIPAPEAAQ